METSAADRAPVERPSDAGPASRPAIPPVVVGLWVVAAMVALGLVAVGAWTGARREPPPVLAEVPDFALTAHDGRAVTRADFAGDPWIADFIFTRCPAICPRMTQQMRHVAESLPAGSPVRIASFSVDPEHDTPEVLAAFAEKHGAAGTPVDWVFLTGEVEALDSLTVGGFLLPLDRSPPPEIVAGSGAILHSNRFVLVDAQTRIRGYYDAFDSADLARLLGDVEALRSER